MEKILISGTGRCGTTFLNLIFSFLQFDTGFQDYPERYIDEVCRAGLELDFKNELLNKNYYIIKDPTLLGKIDEFYDYGFKIKFMIIPIRSFKESAISREKLKNKGGGLTYGCITSIDQETHYEKQISLYIQSMVKYDIPTIFIDFKKMTTSSQYLYNKIKIILDEKSVSFEDFDRAYKKSEKVTAPPCSEIKKLPLDNLKFVENLRKQTFNQNYLIFDNGAPKNILFLGTCRIAPLMWYFNQVKHIINRNIYGIYIVELLTNPSLLSNLDKEKIRAILKNTDIIVYEKIKNVNGFNTHNFEKNSFFHTFDIRDTLTLLIPNLYVKQFYFEMDNYERSNYGNTVSNSTARFKKSCEATDFSQLYDFFCKNNLKYRLFASSLHPTRILSLFLFKLLCKRLHITLPRSFFEENINIGFIDNEACPITKHDISINNYTFSYKLLAETDNIPLRGDFSLWDKKNPIDPQLYPEYVEVLFRE
jgi:hypothetical protein